MTNIKISMREVCNMTIYHVKEKKKVKDKLRDFYLYNCYKIRSYIKLESCTYCGESNDPCDMCYLCDKRMNR